MRQPTIALEPRPPSEEARQREPASAGAVPGRRRLRLGLRAKLLASVVLYLGLLALVGLLGLYAAEASLTGFDVALQHHVREISVFSDISEEVGRVQATTLLHVLASTPEDQARYEQSLAEHEANVERLMNEQLQIQRRFQDDADIDRVERFRAAWRTYLKTWNQDVLPLSRANRDAEALRLVEPNGALDQAYQRVIGELSSVQDVLEAESRDRLQDSEAQYVRNRDVLVGTLMLAGLFGVAFGLSQSSRLARTIQAISRAARQVAAGDFSPRLIVRTGDEIEALAASFNTMTSNLQRMNEEQRAVERMKDEFVSTVSHELRTPMNGVIGMTDLLLAGDLGPRERRYAEGVHRSGLALLNIVNDILDHSKIEAGKLDLESIPLDVRETLNDVVRLFSERASSKGVELTASVADEVPAVVLGDPGRLRQVLINLIGNAVKFTPGGLVRVSVARVKPETCAEARLRLQVADTGIGIPFEARERLFEPFTQLDGSTTREFGGTGLGLSICKRLVGLMGGEIGVQSEPGLGSTFWFTLPCRVPADVPSVLGLGGFACAAGQQPFVQSFPATAGANPQPGEAAGFDPPAPEVASRPAPIHRPLPAPDSDTASPRVLLVEDSWINQQVGLSMLEQLGYRADVVDSGRAALRVLASGARYAAVLMDCQMPGLDGFRTAAEIRRLEAASPKPRHVPIVAFTASAMAGDRDRCLAAGMSDYVAKPVGLTDLSRVLAHWTRPFDPSGPPSETPPVVDSTGPPAAGDVSPSPGAAEPKEASAKAPTPSANGILDGQLVLDPAALDPFRRLQRPGRSDLLATVLDRFQSDAPERLRALQTAVEANDAQAFWQTAHALKGDSGRIGARQVHHLSAEIERLGREGQIAEAATLLPQLSEALSLLGTHLRAWPS